MNIKTRSKCKHLDVFPLIEESETYTNDNKSLSFKYGVVKCKLCNKNMRGIKNISKYSCYPIWEAINPKLCEHPKYEIESKIKIVKKKLQKCSFKKLIIEKLTGIQQSENYITFIAQCVKCHNCWDIDIFYDKDTENIEDIINDKTRWIKNNI